VAGGTEDHPRIAAYNEVVEPSSTEVNDMPNTRAERTEEVPTTDDSANANPTLEQRAAQVRDLLVQDLQADKGSAHGALRIGNHCIAARKSEELSDCGGYRKFRTGCGLTASTERSG
jgi:hypothetical protein